MQKYKVYFNGEKFVAENERSEPSNNIKEDSFIVWLGPKSFADSEASRFNNLFKDCMHKCKDCGDYFFMDDQEMAWYHNKGLHIPRRCHSCREMRRHREIEKEISEYNRGRWK